MNDSFIESSRKVWSNKLPDFVLFVDCDGPLIPSPLYYMDMGVSHKRSHMSNIAIGWLRYLCREVGARIVCNTVHNGHIRHDVIDTRYKEFTIRDDMVQHGLEYKNFHYDWQTKYYIDDSLSRFGAIVEWLSRNYPDGKGVSWAIFDDDVKAFNGHSRLVPIDFRVGIDYNSVVHALKILNPQYDFDERDLNVPVE